MKLNRRNFITLGAIASAVSSVLPNCFGLVFPDPPQQAKLRLSCQEGVAPGKTLAEKLDFLEELGFEGIEPGGGNLPNRVEEFQKALQGRKIRISAVCAGFSGVPISSNAESRKQAVQSIKEILTAAGALGSTGLIVVPAFKDAPQLPHWEAREMLVNSILPELGEHAVKAGTRILLEPLNRGEAHFLRQLADAAAICRDSKSPGVCMMGDFWHMTFEETSDFAAFVAAGKYLHHVHMASRKRRIMPGEDEGDNYVDGFKGLKFIGYQDFVSFECGTRGDRKETLKAAVKLLREQWTQA